MLLVMVRGAGGVMRVDRVHVQLLGHALRLLQPVIALGLHRREVRERLQPALVVRAVAGLLDLAMRRRHHLIIVRAVTGGRRAGRPHRRGTTAAAAGAASRGSSGANMMLQVGILRQHVVQVVRMMVMIVGPVAGPGRVGRVDGEEDTQVIAPGPHGSGDAAHSSLHVLVSLDLVVVMLLLIVQVTMGRQRAVLMHFAQMVMLLRLLLMMMLMLMMIGRGG